MSEQRKKTLRRRDFVKASAMTTAGLILANPKSAFSAQANSRINLGVIGPGGRGTHDAGVFVSVTETQVTALTDAFPDRLEAAKNALDARLVEKGRPKIDKKRLYPGMKGYEELLVSGVDAVLITSPPFYHPEHIEAAVEAGVHVYTEKPVGTDVYGCKRVIKAGEKAEGKLSVQVGFQLRNSRTYAEIAKRIARGDIGEPVSGQIYYHSGALGDRSHPGESKDQTRLRNWVFDIALSGDIIVEQNVHCIDMANWLLQSHPTKAVGNGGQKARVGLGDCYDHFQVLYTYPNDVQMAFTSTQFLKGWGDVAVRIYGTKGVAEIHYGSPNRI
ncbi:MAG: Gfo/Idh/MocA family oxidoreductase, partial [bacterium]